MSRYASIARDDLAFAIEVCEDWLQEYDDDHWERGTYATKIDCLRGRLQADYDDS